ncbi:GntR family transcriptional regulator [Citrobacter amalonaticus]|uniref:GntR family transcriptional regulator n=1 Tax=Citrobacter amalonaticus TaxID=35703 RepID=A0A2S4RQW8_CITAM|nr:GntR family transcriptional regulator [Citrobacter amalonaticus]POT54623.1 GntR family transcriptional regulator [Citrobacter amalonaticus]POT69569.1 GntR family transcriptional regulator [Citrobacter amalonaticus]POU60380.1 GntR family transcriptional regulator [Citrobacter amalonaticus]POV02675.1 GntR family transcriptional regulator [Citrobacter amalonaticus]
MAHNSPIYIRIQDKIREGIADGVWKPGERLPSENELANQFSTTRATVVHAMQGLLSDGLIDRIRGKGTFVKASPIVTQVRTQELGFFEKDLEGSNLTVEYRLLEFAPAPLTPALRKNLQLGEKAKIYRLMRLRIVNGKPLALEIRYLEASLAVSLSHEKLAVMAIQPLIEQQLNVKIGTIHNQVRVTLPGTEIASVLEIKKARPVMVRRHTCLAQDQTPVLWGETFYREEYEIQYSSYRGK